MEKYGFVVQTFVLKKAGVFPKPLMFSVVFMSLYSLGISLFKVKVYSFSNHTFLLPH